MAIKSSQKLLEEFVFWDCQLGQHPRMQASVFLKRGSSLVCTAAVGPQAKKVAGTELHVEEKETTLLIEGEPFGPEESGEPIHSFVAPVEIGPEVAGIVVLGSSQRLPNEAQAQNQAELLGALVALFDPHLSSFDTYSGWFSAKYTPFSKSVAKYLGDLRQEKGIQRHTLAATLGVSRDTLHSWEFGVRSPRASHLYSWLRALELIAPKKQALAYTLEIGPQLLRLIEAQPTTLHQLTPEQFESWIAERLDAAGFSVTLTGGTQVRDGGIDIIAVPRGNIVTPFLLAVQVKHRREGYKVGRAVVDRMLAWKDGPFNAGMVVTNTYFTSHALWLASEERNRHFIRLRDFADLEAWIRGNFWSEKGWRELPREINLAPGITINIKHPSRVSFEKQGEGKRVVLT